MLVKTKKCSHCQNELPLDRFYNNNCKADKFSSCCKKCQNRYNVLGKRIENLKSSGEFKWICDYGHVNILDYDPIDDIKRYKDRVCNKCINQLT